MATLLNTHLAARITFSPELYGPYQYIPGTYYVRTYLVYEDPNETGWYNALGDAELLRRAQRSLDLLNNAYNEYGIYFILDNQIPFGCFDKSQLPGISNPAQHAQLESEILQHRSAMDTWGGKILRNYLLDTTGYKKDSVLNWMDHVRRFETDLRLACHYFFTADFATAATWIANIPSRNPDMDSLQTAELDEIEAVFALLEPHLQNEGSVNSLPRTVLDSLGYWAPMCTQPGFLCKALLRRNGVDVATDCGAGITDRAIREKLSKRTANNIISGVLKLYPNPADEVVRIVAGEYPMQIRLTDVYGRIVISERVFESDELLDTSKLPPGCYWLTATTTQGIYGSRPLIITH